MSVEVRNDSGNRTLIFLCGGQLVAGGIMMLPLDKHNDYQPFLSQATKGNWRIAAISGTQMPDYYEMMISNNARKYAERDGRKPTLIGHSAGGTAGLLYAKDNPSEDYFDRILLFNAPLICPDTRVPLMLQRAYDGAERITADVTLTMSKFDDSGIMEWKIGNFTMMDAIEAVRKLRKKNVKVIFNTTDSHYKHSPFHPVTVAWDTLNSPRILRRSRTKRTAKTKHRKQ